jgi:hypothetical protein
MESNMAMRLVVLLFAFTLPLHGQKSAPQPVPHVVTTSARYQLVSLEFDQALNVGGTATSEPPSRSRAVFLLDSQTGRVWRYQPELVWKGKDNEPMKVPELFIPLQVLPPSDGLKVSPE